MLLSAGKGLRTPVCARHTAHQAQPWRSSCLKQSSRVWCKLCHWRAAWHAPPHAHSNMDGPTADDGGDAGSTCTAAVEVEVASSVMAASSTEAVEVEANAASAMEPATMTMLVTATTPSGAADDDEWPSTKQNATTVASAAEATPEAAAAAAAAAAAIIQLAGGTGTVNIQLDVSSPSPTPSPTPPAPTAATASASINGTVPASTTINVPQNELTEAAMAAAKAVAAVPRSWKMAAAGAVLLLGACCILPRMRPQPYDPAYPYAFSVTTHGTSKVPSAAQRAYVAGEHRLAGEQGVDTIGAGAQEWLAGRVAYLMQQMLTAGVAEKIFALTFVAMPIVLMYGALYRRASGLPWRESFYKVYALLYRVPGVGIKEEINFQSYLVANAVFLSGVFSFAALLGIVSDEIKNGIKAARSGNYPVRTSSHVVILNWNAQTTGVLRQIAAAHTRSGASRDTALMGRSNKVVILADKDKATMDAMVQETLRSVGAVGDGLEVHTRRGVSYKLSDLRKVAAGRASTVILMHPDGVAPSSAEAIKASAAMCLTALGTSQDHQRVVVQMPGELPAGADVLASLTSTAEASRREFQVLQLPDLKVMDRLVAQTAVQPGILTVWFDILALGPGSSQFRCMPVPPALGGQTFAAVRRCYMEVVVCGTMDSSGSIHFNPPDSMVVAPEDQLIVLTKSGPQALPLTVAQMHVASNLHTEAARLASERLQQERTYRSQPRSIIMAGFPVHALRGLMDGFREFTPAGTAVTIITTQDANAGEGMPSRLGNCRFNFVTAAHPTSPKVLLDAGIKTADAVVLGDDAESGITDMESDARMLAAILQTQDAVLASKRKDAPHIVAPIRRYATSKLAHSYLDTLHQEHGGSTAAATQPDNIIRRPEFLIHHDVVSALLTQVAAEPVYAKVMRELLFTHKGHELYLRNPKSFNIPLGEPIRFAELVETVRLTRQTAIGYMRNKSGAAIMAPHALHEVVFQEDDKIIVLAEEY